MDIDEIIFSKYIKNIAYIDNVIEYNTIEYPNIIALNECLLDMIKLANKQYNLDDSIEYQRKINYHPGTLIKEQQRCVNYCSICDQKVYDIFYTYIGSIQETPIFDIIYTLFTNKTAKKKRSTFYTCSLCMHNIIKFINSEMKNVSYKKISYLLFLLKQIIILHNINEDIFNYIFILIINNIK
jgi:hypothetical protein